VSAQKAVDDEPTPDGCTGNFEEYTKDLIDRGYTQQDGKWVHPSDPEIWYMFNSTTLEINFSDRTLLQPDEGIDSARQRGGQ
jgi:hypothetical protein